MKKIQIKRNKKVKCEKKYKPPESIWESSNDNTFTGNLIYKNNANKEEDSRPIIKKNSNWENENNKYEDDNEKKDDFNLN